MKKVHNNNTYLRALEVEFENIKKYSRNKYTQHRFVLLVHHINLDSKYNRKLNRIQMHCAYNTICAIRQHTLLKY